MKLKRKKIKKLAENKNYNSSKAAITIVLSLVDILMTTEHF